MRSRYEAYGRPPHFANAAQLINDELENRRDQENNKVTLVKGNREIVTQAPVSPIFNKSKKIEVENWLRRLDETYLQKLIRDTSNKNNDPISQTLNKLARNEQASRGTTEANRSEFYAKHDQLIDRLIKKYGLPFEVIDRLVRTESDYEWVVNGIHAVGPMQIVPNTAKLIANKTPWTVDQIFNDEKNLLSKTGFGGIQFRQHRIAVENTGANRA